MSQACYTCEQSHMLTWVRLPDDEGVMHDVPMCMKHYDEWSIGNKIIRKR